MELNKIEKSLLLYIETCAVDYQGFIDNRHTNREEFDILKEWNKDKFILFKRIKMSEIKGHRTYYCELSELAWESAHKERKARALRNSKNELLTGAKNV